MEPWLAHPLGDTGILLVVGKDGEGHFYWDTRSGKATWTLDSALSLEVRLSEVAEVMARARGFTKRPTDSGLSKVSSKVNVSEPKQTPEPDPSVAEIYVSSETELLDSDVQNILASVIPMPSRNSEGLELGYGSSSDDGAEDQEIQEAKQKADADSLKDSSSEVPIDPKAFFELLDSLQCDVYSAWPLVEEANMELLAHDPRYYAVDDKDRAKYFDMYCEARQEEVLLELPASLEYLEFLGEHKPEVKKIPSYVGFYNTHAVAINGIDLEKSTKAIEYERFRRAILEFGCFAKTLKSEQPEANAKVFYLKRYLASLADDDLPDLVPDTWTELATLLSFEVSHACANYMVGTEKRVTCYKQRAAKKVTTRVNLSGFHSSFHPSN